jgi:hypothetical protein
MAGGFIVVGLVGIVLFTTRAAQNPASDLNADTQVNVLDLSILLSNYGKSGTGLKGDINADGAVNISDMSILLSSWGMTTGTPTPTPAPTPGPTQAYLVDEATRTMTINPIGDYTTNLRTLMGQLVTKATATTPWTLRFMPGTYTLTGTIVTSNLDHVHITSVDQIRPATITKPSSSVDYFLTFRFANNIRISYLTFVGVTSVYDPAWADGVNDSTEAHWPDQGIWFGSSHDTRVDHSTFRNIGNAAIRHNTRLDDPIRPINSYNHFIEDNLFEKVWQVTTTQDGGNTHGGSRDWWVQRNTFKGIYGSLKFCSRTSGASGGHILNNTFLDTVTGPIELCGTTNIEIKTNTFTNINGLVVSAYTNDSAASGYHWGDNITFSGNSITNARQGIRFAYDRYSDGFQPVGHNLVVSGNTFNQMYDTDTGRGTIRVVNGPMIGASILNNTLQIVNNNPWDFETGSSGIVIQGNTVNGASYNTP